MSGRRRFRAGILLLITVTGLLVCFGINDHRVDQVADLRPSPDHNARHDPMSTREGRSSSREVTQIDELSPKTSFRVALQVVDPDGRPIAGVDLTFLDVAMRNRLGGDDAAEPMSDELGRIRVHTWPRGGVAHLSKRGFLPTSLPEPSGTPNTEEVVVTMEPLLIATVSGRVIDHAGIPVVGAVVQANGVGISMEKVGAYASVFGDAQVRTSESGEFVIASAPAAYALRVVAMGEFVGNSIVVPALAPGEHRSGLEIRLPHSRAMTLSVVDRASGSPIRNAFVRPIRTQWVSANTGRTFASSSEARTDAQGRCVIHVVQDEPATVEILGVEGYSRVEVALPPRIDALEVRLSRAERIEFSVAGLPDRGGPTESRPRPKRGAANRFSGDVLMNPRSLVTMTVTGLDTVAVSESCSIEWMSYPGHGYVATSVAGRVRLELFHDGKSLAHGEGESSSTIVLVGDCASIALTAALRLRVLDANAEAMSGPFRLALGASSAGPGSDAVLFGSTDEEGVFEIEGLMPGEYRIEVWDGAGKATAIVASMVLLPDRTCDLGAVRLEQPGVLAVRVSPWQTASGSTNRVRLWHHDAGRYLTLRRGVQDPTAIEVTAGGAVEIDGLVSGAVRVELWDGPNSERAIESRIEAGARVEVEL